MSKFKDWSLGWRIGLLSDNIERAYEIVCEDKSHNFGRADFVTQGKAVLDSKLRRTLENMRPFRFTRPNIGIDVEEKRIEFMEHIVNTQIERILS